MKTHWFFFLLLALPLKFANAATYYVDASYGNDKWSGNQSSRIGSPPTDGPWQSLGKVSAKVLAPGDSVLLKCGGIWHETLRLQSSGTATSPITIGAYPNACANKPIISGATPIPAHNWVHDAGNIYKVSTAIDLITFGTFEKGLGNWTKWSPQNNATMSLTTNCAQTNNTCMSFTGGSGYSIAISNNFTIQGKQSYTATFTVKAPQGVRIQAILRRGPPWDTAGLAASITGTDTWQTFSLPFVATASLSNARLDFVVPAGVNIGLDNVKLTTALTDVGGVFDSGKAINVAHHPNRGYDSLKPQSLYYAIAENADQVSIASDRFGSSYLTTGTDLSSLAHPAITAGTSVRIRTNAWTLSNRKIASVSGSRLYFDSPTPYPIKKGWGYFLYGQRWMLDEPGEWHYDAATKTIYVWMADNATPGNRISAGQRASGIEASNLSHIRIEGLAIHNTGTGVRMARATNLVLRNMNISDTLGLGVDAARSTDSGIESSQLIRTAGDAISAAFPGNSSLRFHAYNNLIVESSSRSRSGVITSLPEPARAAIEAGRSPVIRGNRIYGAGYIGIWAQDNSLISGNHIENACLILDDCGAIYTSGQNNNSTIENNTVHHVVGGLPGKPADTTQAQGIYLDELTSGVTIRGNTVVDADNGIQLHNAANNRIENNTLYGNRRHHIWLQEGTNRLSPEGDIHGNLILGNRLFATSATPVIRQDTILTKTNTHRFASYDNNLYFTFLWPTISSEAWPGGGNRYTLSEWQAAVTSTSLPRNLDLTSREVNNASTSYAVSRTIGPNVVPNGNFSSGKTGWSSWNLTDPRGQMVLEPCPPAGQCLRYTAGASESLVSSPNFTVHQDQWYKLSVDLKTGTNGQSVSALVRRGGGGLNGYESLMGATVSFKGSTSWQRYGLIFKAVKTINARDPVTLDLGARVDFTRILPGQNVSIANLEVVPLSAIEVALRSHILINPTATTLALNCPDGSNPVACGEYVRFTDSQAVTWPYALPSHGSEIIYSRDSTLVDGDRDGIPDYQDLCNATGASLAVNAAGCAFGQ